MPTVLITGAGRGLGLEFARQYAADGWRVDACCREPAKAAALKKLGGDVTVHPLDVRDGKGIAALAKTLAGEPIDVLLNNAGIYGPRGQALAAIDDKAWLEVFQVNAIAPLRIADALAGNVAQSKRKLMVFITSQMGSIARMGTGAHPYRMSKSALNSGVRCLSLDLEAQGIACVVFHPGWVKTDMGGSAAPVEPKTSIAGMRAVIAKLKASDNGRFFGYDGEEIPW